METNRTIIGNREKDNKKISFRNGKKLKKRIINTAQSLVKNEHVNENIINNVEDRIEELSKEYGEIENIRIIFDYAFDLFQCGDIKSDTDFSKVKNLLYSKFKKFKVADEDIKKVFLLSFRSYKNFIKSLTEGKGDSYYNDLLNKNDIEAINSHFKKSKHIKNSMHFALDNIRITQRTKLLTKEEEYLYARMAIFGETEEEKMRGRGKLIDANLRLVASIAKKYNNKGIPLPDLVDEGIIGMAKSISRFAPDKGYRFSTYSTHWIRQAITRAISDKARMVRLPTHIIYQIQKTSQEERNLSLRKGMDPDVERLSETVKIKHKIKLDKLKGHKKTGSEPLYFDRTISKQDDSKYVDFVADSKSKNLDEELKEKNQLSAIREMLQCLSSEERKVITHLYGLFGKTKCKNLTEVSRVLGFRVEKVKNLKISAFKKVIKVKNENKKYQRILSIEN